MIRVSPVLRFRGAVLTLAGILATGALASAPRQAPASSVSVYNVGEVIFGFAAPTHTPKAGASWPVVVRAARNGRGLPGRVRLDVLSGSRQAGRATKAALRGGTYRHVLRWPRSAIGYSLTVRAVVSAGGSTRTFMYRVRVRG